ncbi:phosphate signaling complex protein PhoU [Clostridium sp. D2Q-11]|uniref:Phosphate-specific transport system accessory protein PhoU n=1 Tax=Anaeromonas frigoriresistens TaxID=2683708 RepID=A0A942UZW4_9FIRM|nr:phosphate signaling complex protein PhoU [Anaeromonas frigoriresistens]MBS4540101.1 phosphate signaling complex protein PhoU [Anaeromonas frigoriresistens]
MRKYFDKELENLHDSLLKMGVMVEEMIDISIDSLLKQDDVLADKVIELDDRVDEMEIKIEKKCLELIALQQPMAKDLRDISAILKIITDLERIGDHGVNIAKVTKKLSKEDYIKPLIDIPRMANISKKMIRKSLDSFVKKDIELAKEAAKMDDEIDDIYEKIYLELLEMLTQNKEIMTQVVNLLFIGRYIERIADHTTNICERIIYMVSGIRVEY